MSENKNIRRKPLWKLLLLNHGVIMAVTFIAVFITFFVSSLVAFIIGAMGGLLLLIYGVTIKNFGTVMAGVLIMMMGSSGFQAEDFYRLKQGKIIKNISVAESPNYQNPAGFYFKDSRVLTDKVGYGSQAIQHWSQDFVWYSYKFYFAAPLVSADWTKDDSIYLWTICQGGENYTNKIDEAERGYLADCVKEWQKPWQAVVVEKTTAGIEDAVIKNAEETHGIKSAASPLAVSWVPSPEREINKRAEIIVRMLLYANFISFLSLIAGRLISILYRKIKSGS